MASQPYDLFISHATEDKAGFVEPLVAALDEKGLSVWYDRKIFKLGDSIRGKIDEGLAGTRFGVVVLSQTYAAKQWTKNELGALMAKETDGEKVILPIWHGVGTEDVKRLFPTLADRIAVSSGEGIDACVEAIVDALSDEGTPVSPTQIRPPGGVGLGQEEKEILLAAVSGEPEDVVMEWNTGGHRLEAGGRDLTQNADRRAIARYRAAVQRLVSRGHLDQSTASDCLYDITHQGYEAADRLKAESTASVEPTQVQERREELGQGEQELLVAAAGDDGYVLSAGHKQGHDVQAGGRNFTQNANPRTIEKYKAAVRKLVERRYLEAQGHKNEVFKVSHEGYEAADKIRGNVLVEPVEPPDWAESLARYRQDFPDVAAFLSISNAFGRNASVSYDEFRETVIKKRLNLGDMYGWPWFGPPPEGMNPEWQRRRGVRLPYFEKYYWDILESGHFLFCTNTFTWNDDDTSSVGVRTMLYHLLVDLTFAGRVAAAFGVSGSGGGVELSLHGVKGRRLHCQADLQTVFPECTVDRFTAPLDYAFSSNPDAIREAAIDVVYELLTYFPQPHDGSRLIHRNQLEQPARDIQQKNGLLGDT